MHHELASGICLGMKGQKMLTFNLEKSDLVAYFIIFLILVLAFYKKLHDVLLLTSQERQRCFF